MPPTLEHPAETEARLNKWFRGSKFGAFIHFGAYSQLAGKYQDRVSPKKYAEWVQMDLGSLTRNIAERSWGSSTPRNSMLRSG